MEALRWFPPLHREETALLRSGARRLRAVDVSLSPASQGSSALLELEKGEVLVPADTEGPPMVLKKASENESPGMAAFMEAIVDLLHVPEAPQPSKSVPEHQQQTQEQPQQQSSSIGSVLPSTPNLPVGGGTESPLPPPTRFRANQVTVPIVPGEAVYATAMRAVELAFPQAVLAHSQQLLSAASASLAAGSSSPRGSAGAVGASGGEWSFELTSPLHGGLTIQVEVSGDAVGSDVWKALNPLLALADQVPASVTTAASSLSSLSSQPSAPHQATQQQQPGQQQALARQLVPRVWVVGSFGKGAALAFQRGGGKTPPFFPLPPAPAPRGLPLLVDTPVLGSQAAVDDDPPSPPDATVARPLGAPAGPPLPAAVSAGLAGLGGNVGVFGGYSNEFSKTATTPTPANRQQQLHHLLHHHQQQSLGGLNAAAPDFDPYHAHHQQALQALQQQAAAQNHYYHPHTPQSDPGPAYHHLQQFQQGQVPYHPFAPHHHPQHPQRHHSQPQHHFPPPQPQQQQQGGVIQAQGSLPGFEQQHPQHSVPNTAASAGPQSVFLTPAPITGPVGHSMATSATGFPSALTGAAAGAGISIAMTPEQELAQGMRDRLSVICSLLATAKDLVARANNNDPRATFPFGLSEAAIQIMRMSQVRCEILPEYSAGIALSGGVGSPSGSVHDRLSVISSGTASNGSTPPQTDGTAPRHRLLDGQGQRSNQLDDDDGDIDEAAAGTSPSGAGGVVKDVLSKLDTSGDGDHNNGNKGNSSAAADGANPQAHLLNSSGITGAEPYTLFFPGAGTTGGPAAAASDGNGAGGAEMAASFGWQALSSSTGVGAGAGTGTPGHDSPSSPHGIHPHKGATAAHTPPPPGYPLPQSAGPVRPYSPYLPVHGPLNRLYEDLRHEVLGLNEFLALLKNSTFQDRQTRVQLSNPEDQEKIFRSKVGNRALESLSPEALSRFNALAAFNAHQNGGRGLSAGEQTQARVRFAAARRAFLDAGIIPLCLIGVDALPHLPLPLTGYSDRASDANHQIGCCLELLVQCLTNIAFDTDAQRQITNLTSVCEPLFAILQGKLKACLEVEEVRFHKQKPPSGSASAAGNGPNGGAFSGLHALHEGFNNFALSSPLGGAGGYGDGNEDSSGEMSTVSTTLGVVSAAEIGIKVARCLITLCHDNNQTSMRQIILNGGIELAGLGLLRHFEHGGNGFAALKHCELLAALYRCQDPVPPSPTDPIAAAEAAATGKPPALITADLRGARDPNVALALERCLNHEWIGRPSQNFEKLARLAEHLLSRNREALATEQMRKNYDERRKQLARGSSTDAGIGTTVSAVRATSAIGFRGGPGFSFPTSAPPPSQQSRYPHFHGGLSAAGPSATPTSGSVGLGAMNSAGTGGVGYRGVAGPTSLPLFASPGFSSPLQQHQLQMQQQHGYGGSAAASATASTVALPSPGLGDQASTPSAATGAGMGMGMSIGLPQQPSFFAPHHQFPPSPAYGRGYS